jgi:(p)ppGpp synthase/HD superfamily hydrolase
VSWWGEEGERMIERIAEQILPGDRRLALARHEDRVRELHKDHRYSDMPYIIHLYDVMRISVRDLVPTVSPLRDVLALFALYHDAIEDTELTLEGFLKLFKGADEDVLRFASIVMTSLTDPEGGSRKERKAAQRELYEAHRKLYADSVEKGESDECLGLAIEVAVRVKLADRLAHLERIHLVLADRTGVFDKEEGKRAKSFLKMYSKEHAEFIAAVCPVEHPLKSKISLLITT